MILDLFSHKIHSSGDEWPDKLVEIAAIFNEFVGLTKMEHCLGLTFVNVKCKHYAVRISAKR